MAAACPVVLAVADDPLLCQFVEALLSSRGYAVESMDGPTAALGRLEAGHVDLIVLDLGWPEIDGLEVCQRLRAVPRAAKVPIIALTDSPAEQQQVSGFAMCPQEYVTKPFDIDELLAAVARYCPTEE